MVSMKIGISGKVNSGKDTLSQLLSKELSKLIDGLSVKSYSFSMPMKKITEIMFPSQEIANWLYGPSDGRKNIIPGAFKNGVPLTVRQFLLDLGTEFGRSYNDNVWVNSTINQIEKDENYLSNELDYDDIISIVTDCRFLNEFKALKDNKFIMIRIRRNDASNIQHISDTEQDQIPDSDFDFVIDNNNSLASLEAQVKRIAITINSCYILT